MGWMEDTVDDFRYKLNQVNQMLDGYDGPGAEQVHEFVDACFYLVEQAAVGITEPFVIEDTIRDLAGIHQYHTDLLEHHKHCQANFLSEYQSAAQDDAYLPLARNLLADMETSGQIMQTMYQQHVDLRFPLDTLWVARLALIGSLVWLAGTLASLIFTALADAPVAVPVAGVEVYGATSSATTIATTTPTFIGLLGNIFTFIWSDTQALLVTNLLLVDVAALTWTFEDPKDAQMLVDTAIAVVGSLIVYSTIKRTIDGREIRVRPLSPKEVGRLRSGNKTFEDLKAEEGWPANAVIYVDQDGNYWIGGPGSDFVEPFG